MKHTNAHAMHYVNRIVLTETLTQHAPDNEIRFTHLCMCTVCLSMCVCPFFVPMLFLVNVNPHLFSIRPSGKPSTMQPPPNGLVCIMDPHDVSSLALSLHSSPCSHIIQLPHKQSDETTVSIIMSATYYYCV